MEGTEDAAVLSTLGANIIQESAYESEIINQLQKKLDGDQPKDKPDKTETAETSIENKFDPNESNEKIEVKEKSSDGENVNDLVEHSKHFDSGVETLHSVVNKPSDILGFKESETEKERKIRTGEITPFGTSIGGSAEKPTKYVTLHYKYTCTSL